jgi:CheY-like chemotaxis protein
MTKQNPLVLLIEDESQQLEMLRMLFESEGYAVEGMANAEDAFNYLMQNTPDVIISDIKLPGLDGISLFEKLRIEKKTGSVPFIFITGYNDPKAIEQVKQLGASGYVTKPYDLTDLLETVRKVLSKY